MKYLIRFVSDRATGVVILACVLFAPNVHAQRLHFGTNIVQAGQVIEFNAPLNSRAHAELFRLRLQAQSARGALVTPVG